MGHEYSSFFSFGCGISPYENHLTHLLFYFLFLFCFLSADLRLILPINSNFYMFAYKWQSFAKLCSLYENNYHIKINKYIANAISMVCGVISEHAVIVYSIRCNARYVYRKIFFYFYKYQVEPFLKL